MTMTTTHRSLRYRVALVGAVVATCVAASSTALAETSRPPVTPEVYTMTLVAVNTSGAQGTIELSLAGSEATITEQVSGLGATFEGTPYPHVQHIHIGGKGTCPPASADKDHDGLISTTEGIPYYGGIGASLTTKGATGPSAGTALNVAPTGSSFNYKRTIKLDADTIASLRAGTANVVIHGLDPLTVPVRVRGEKSELVPSLPAAATAPALCGFFTRTTAAAPAPTAPEMPPAEPMPAKPTFTG